ncbi:hypothetical protein EVAR_47748_1 [Eumeta japonica]|uniref:Reverse transcriptase domain-containing protein n=1 Tax=Eumeta variegata TaxID=151549 RepID=A0A4C1VUQ2_EUMVA|nr:hypothetical protein EVAR_47748_1 [Eumeta japonica]
MGCMDQFFFSAKCCRKVFSIFVDLEKAFDTVKRNDLWRTISMHGVSSGLIQALQSLNRGSSTCVRINRAYTDGYDIRRGVREGYAASLWLFNLFIDICLYDLNEYECGLRMDELMICQVLPVCRRPNNPCADGV